MFFRQQNEVYFNILLTNVVVERNTYYYDVVTGYDYIFDNVILAIPILLFDYYFIIIQQSSGI